MLSAWVESIYYKRKMFLRLENLNPDHVFIVDLLHDIGIVTGIF